MELHGQRALVTGGAGGIGLAAINALHAKGAQVTFTARSLESLNTAKADLPKDVQGVICDIRNHAQLQKICASGFDILINNAGVIEPIGLMAEIDFTAFSASIETNLTAQFAAIQCCLPYMLAQKRGTVVNVSSGAAHRPKEGWSAYCAGKAGMAMLTQSLHLEYGAMGIRSFGLAPGVVDTGMQVKIRASGINAVSQIPRENLSPPSEAGQALAWLCTKDADALIGQELDIRSPDFRAAAALDL